MAEARGNQIPRELGRIGLLFVLIVAVVFGTYSLLNDPPRTAVFTVLQPLVDFACAGFLLSSAWQMRERARRQAITWGIIGLAVLLFGIGDLIWSYLQLATHGDPFPTAADAFFLAYFPIFLVGVLQFIDRRATRLGQVHIGLDLTTIFVAAALVSWNLLIGPIVESSASESLVNRLILWAYPVGDLMLLGALVLIIYYMTDEHEIASMVVLAAAICIMVITDCVYAYRTLAGTYQSGELWDSGWMAANVLTALAVLPQRRLALSSEPMEPRRANDRVLEVLAALRTYLPYGALLLGYVLMLRGGITGLSMSPLTLALGMGLIVMLVLLRQMTTLNENLELTSELVTKAGELEKVNRYLSVQVTERKRMEEKLSYDTLHDIMTGLPNRTMFLEVLHDAIQVSRHRPKVHPYAVLFIDIDHFKIVNDSLGHMIGDQLLWAIGARLKGALRSTDTLARFGGDEFAILMDGMAHEDSANALANRVQRSLQQSFRIEGHELHMTASIGIVGDVASYEQAEDLLRDADLAMYEAKTMGKSRFQTFAVKMRKRALLRLEMEAELRRALINRELTVYYQPIVSLKSFRVAGLEALVRWQHPKKGLLRPREFLNIAEESGLILRLGEQVLWTACDEMRRLEQHHPGLTELGVSVNVSNKQFTQPGLTSAVSVALREAQLHPRALKLEITERVLIENMRLANRVFNELNGLGVRFDIDDFGTGYSALSYLQDFPIHALKIDQGFISSIRRNEKALGLVRAIVTMAHELGIETVAEGVTNKSQLEDLQEVGCDYGQGVLLSRPLRAEGVGGLLERVDPQNNRGRTRPLAARFKPPKKQAAGGA